MNATKFAGAMRYFCAILAAAFFLILPRIGRADGLIVISDSTPVPNHFAFAPMEVTYHHVNVDINDQVAVTKVDEEFYNPHNRQLEGTYIFPLPTGAHIDKFSMDINGTMAEAELLDADKARHFYEEIVRKMRDPALLEYAGRDAIRVHIFPIEANGSKHIKLQYTQALKNDSGLIEYLYPLNTEKFSSRPLRDVSVTVNLNFKESIKSIYCPTHDTEIKRTGDRNATIGYRGSNVRPDIDFKILFSTSSSEVGANLITYRTGSEDGYFMLLASPGLNASSKPQAKDVCFVLDTSGSMADDNKLEQAKKALRFCLANLNPDDHFQVIRFSTEVETLFDGVAPADESHVKQARDFVENLKPTGGTSLNDALQKALALRGAETADRPYVVVFLTDGMPTVGETSEDRIVENISRKKEVARVFCFGIGTDVNTHLLDRVAEATRGSSAYVTGKEDIELKVSGFFAKIREPALMNVAVKFEGNGIRTTQIYPNALPDLFKGESLTIFGRYSGSGSGSVRITGTINGEKREFVTDVKFTENDTENSFVPRLWATRRIGWLLDEIRMHGESDELKNEVVMLARKYGVVTPYTAYLIIEDERRRGVPLTQQSLRELDQDRLASDNAAKFYNSNRDEAAQADQRSGGQAVANAQNLGELKSASSFGGGGGRGGGGGGYGNAGAATAQPLQRAAAATTSPSEMQGYKFTTNYAQQVRVVNGRSFYQNSNAWTDSTIQANNNLKQKQIAFGSDEYFDLLKNHPEASQWLALGDQVDLVIDDMEVSVK